MRNLTLLLIQVFLALLLSLPAAAQSFGDSYSSQANSGYYNTTYYNTGSQSLQYSNGQAPVLQGATYGTIGPQGQDATAVLGVNTSGTVRVNNLANEEALLNILANGLEILLIAWGGVTMTCCFFDMLSLNMSFLHGNEHNSDWWINRIGSGFFAIAAGLATPGAINWLVACSRDANLFS